jgi:hypothetical protein
MFKARFGEKNIKYKIAFLWLENNVKLLIFVCAQKDAFGR